MRRYVTATRFWECCANHVVVDRCRIITAWGASMVHPCISPKGLGRLWTVVDGCGRWWTVVGGCGRLWTVVDGSLAGFIRIQNETQQDVAKNLLTASPKQGRAQGSQPLGADTVSVSADSWCVGEIGRRLDFRFPAEGNGAPGSGGRPEVGPNRPFSPHPQGGVSPGTGGDPPPP